MKTVKIIVDWTFVFDNLKDYCIPIPSTHKNQFKKIIEESIFVKTSPEEVG